MWERDEGRKERRRDGREKRSMKEGIKGDDRKGGKRERERVEIEDHKGAGEKGIEREERGGEREKREREGREGERGKREGERGKRKREREG